ncbi:hypothetical protein [Tellurirhabdus bombi]|uniref:hypothetical protein n=1 Tax=Tellurirhabdus bombi TaxID=2907205 RepID=UPI001F46A562|nr:hypothetical protein [Tellurirhabdus bombi]
MVAKNISILKGEQDCDFEVRAYYTIHNSYTMVNGWKVYIRGLGDDFLKSKDWEDFNSFCQFVKEIFECIEVFYASFRALPVYKDVLISTECNSYFIIDERVISVDGKFIYYYLKELAS